MPCYSIEGLKPVVHADAYVHPTAVLIGDVIVGPGVYVGPAACLRGDFGRLILEADSNLQDTCVMHGFPGTDTIVERDGHIGHGAVLHGCRIERDAMVGMNAVIMDNAVVGASSIVAACAFVKADSVLPPRHLIVGMPAQVVRELSDEEIAWKREGTGTYQDLVRRCHASLVEVTPLSAPEPDRPRLDVADVQPLHSLKKRGD